MKIASTDSKPVVPPAAERKSTAGPNKSPVESSTEVALSPAATALSQAASDPSFDSAKVERIAGAIRDGTFKINAEAIADKLIVNAEELLGPPKTKS